MTAKLQLATDKATAIEQQFSQKKEDYKTLTKLVHEYVPSHTCRI